MAEDKEQNNPPNIDDFKGLLGWLETKKEQSNKSGKPWGWVMGLIAAAIAFFSLAIFAYKAWKKGKEIAEVKHKLDTLEEQKISFETKARVEEQLGLGETLEQEMLGTIKKVITYNEEKLRKLEVNSKINQAKIDKINSWDDVDKYLK